MPSKSKKYKSIQPTKVVGANEKIRTGHIGVGGMGRENLKYVLERDDMEAVAICDLWQENLEKTFEQIDEAGKPKPSSCTYFEEVIANKDVDAVVVSTPDHWHAIPSIMACDAGKDVFCEKPLATTIAEGRAMVEAARRNKSVFQAGTMQRSSAMFQEAVHLVQSGYIGKVSRVDTWINEASPAEGIGNPPDEDPPEGLDWERFQGWCPQVPFNKNRFLYYFRFFLEYSGGKMTDWGAHLLDIAVWGMGEEKKPRSVTAAGGKFVVKDNRTTPDQLDVLYEFDDYVLTFSNRVYNDFVHYSGDRSNGIIFFGTLGTLRVSRGSYEVIPNQSGDACEPKKREGCLPMNRLHWDNFADCIRSRERPICDVEVCHATTTVCHLGTAAYVAGGKLGWDAENERFCGGDKEAVDRANAWAFREYQNGWKLTPPYYEGWT